MWCFSFLTFGFSYQILSSSWVNRMKNMNLSSCGSTNSSVLIYASPSPRNQLVMHGIHDAWLVRVYFLICFGRIVGCSKYNICNILKNHKSYKTQNLYIWINLSLALFSMCHGEILVVTCLKACLFTLIIENEHIRILD